MAYFSNGTEGMSYEEQYCSRCMFCEDCPVLTLHMLWNYEQHGESETAKAKRTALDLLIPRTKDGWNEQCRMFVLRTEPLPFAG